MTTQTGRTRQFVRTTILAAIVAVLALTAVQPAHAQEDNESYDNTIIQVAACNLAGGNADVNVDRRGNGYFATSVSCSGGLLDGMECGNDSNGSDCHWKDDELAERRRDKQQAVDGAGVAIDELAVAPEPTATPIVIDEPVDLEPVVDPGTSHSGSSDGPLELTPTAEPIVDAPVVVEEIAPPTDGAEDTGGRELPELRGDVVIDEIIDPGKGDDSGRGELPIIVDVIEVAG